MATFEFDWVDAFTEVAFGGNACAVVHGAETMSDETRMALVRETSLSECAYLVPSEVADFGARYYLADREIPMAGHPTIATVASLLSRGLVDLGAGMATFTLEVGAGILPIEVESRGDRAPLITMTQAPPAIGDPIDPAQIAGIYGLEAADVIAPPRIVSTGTPFCITVLSGHDALRRAELNVKRLHDWQSELQGSPGFLEPFLVTLEGATEKGDTFSRLLLPPPMPAEDPFTGSATGCMGAYLWHEGLIDSPVFYAEQGHWMGRPGRARVAVVGEQGEIEAVRVAGAGVVLMTGRIEL